MKTSSALLRRVRQFRRIAELDSQAKGRERESGEGLEPELNLGGATIKNRRTHRVWRFFYLWALQNVKTSTKFYSAEVPFDSSVGSSSPGKVASGTCGFTLAGASFFGTDGGNSVGEIVLRSTLI